MESICFCYYSYSCCRCDDLLILHRAIAGTCTEHSSIVVFVKGSFRQRIWESSLALKGGLPHHHNHVVGRGGLFQRGHVSRHHDGVRSVQAGERCLLLLENIMSCWHVVGSHDFSSMWIVYRWILELLYIDMHTYESHIIPAETRWEGDQTQHFCRQEGCCIYGTQHITRLASQKRRWRKKR